MTILILTFLIIVLAVMLIQAEYRQQRQRVYFFKPLTTVCIILMAWFIPNPVSAIYRSLILLGLVFSLAGDIFLMLPSDRFVAGLRSFLMAHVCYLAAFSIGSRLSYSYVSLLPLIIYGSVIFWMLFPRLDVPLRIPVAVYMLALLAMCWMAWNRWLSVEHSGSLLAFTGALFFVASDSLLAIDRFKVRFRKARFYVLTTYFTAQWLIAFSITSA
ncbi:MAG: lysoplasmalogenase [bacterium]